MRFLFIIALVIGLFSLSAYATCGTCCSTGNCLSAFRGSEGICCGIKSVDNAFSKPYCCPTNAKCIDDNVGGYKCQLLSTDSASANNAARRTNHASTSSSKASKMKWWHWLLIGLGCLLALGLLTWGAVRLYNYCKYGRTNNKVIIGHNHNGRSMDVRL